VESVGSCGGFALSEGGQFWELKVIGRGSTWPRTRAVSWHQGKGAV
jgi:hypothetical protein